MEESRFYTVRGYQLLEQHKNQLSPSLEDYLEMIYRKIQKDGYIRVNKLASNLNVRPSSSSKMIAKLGALGFVNYEKYGVIRLTEKGDEIGRYLLWRHEIINNFFNFISGNAPDMPFVETELVEHILSKNTVENLEKLLLFFAQNENITIQLKNLINKNN